MGSDGNKFEKNMKSFFLFFTQNLFGEEESIEVPPLWKDDPIVKQFYEQLKEFREKQSTESSVQKLVKKVWTYTFHTSVGAIAGAVIGFRMAGEMDSK